MFDYLVSCVSWEGRFLDGIAYDRKEYEINECIFLIFNTYEEDKEKNLRAVSSFKNSQIIELNFYEPPSIYNKLKGEFYSNKYKDKKILLDISTMPRETIWLTLLFLRSQTQDIEYIYHRPRQYGPGLLSYNPMFPRLIYKMSGIADATKPTLLIVTSGYDFERIDAIKYKYEPAILIILYSFNADYRQEDLSTELTKKYPNDIMIQIDAYNVDSVHAKLKEILSVYNSKNEYNIVCASLGPKPTAISFFKLWQEFPAIGLCYTPSKDYNINYSKGIGSHITGAV